MDLKPKPEERLAATITKVENGYIICTADDKFYVTGSDYWYQASRLLEEYFEPKTDEPELEAEDKE